MYKYRKHAPNEKGLALSARAIAATWKCQPLYGSDKATLKGAQVEIKDDGVGMEPSECLAKMALRGQSFEFPPPGGEAQT